MLPAILLTASLCAGTIKDAIACDLGRLEQEVSPQEASALHYRLALTYEKDQELDKAFVHFLDSLETMSKEALPPLTQDEKALYEEAFALYIAQSGNDPTQVARELKERYEETVHAHPEYAHLDFLLAAAEANLGNFANFFVRFYRGYRWFQGEFLALKTQGVLSLRLSQHGRTPEERYTQQQKAAHLLEQALEKNAQDAGLYKVLVFLAKEQGNDALILSYLQKMLTAKAPIPRGDIYLYVREAVALGEIELGQKIIDRARDLYNYSRAIGAAQDYLNQHIR